MAAIATGDTVTETKPRVTATTRGVTLSTVKLKGIRHGFPRRSVAVALKTEGGRYETAASVASTASVKIDMFTKRTPMAVERVTLTMPQLSTAALPRLRGCGGGCGCWGASPGAARMRRGDKEVDALPPCAAHAALFMGSSFETSTTSPLGGVYDVSCRGGLPRETRWCLTSHKRVRPRDCESVLRGGVRVGVRWALRGW